MEYTEKFRVLTRRAVDTRCTGEYLDAMNVKIPAGEALTFADHD